MNAIAHDSAHDSLKGVINRWSEDPAEDPLDTGLFQSAALVAATGLGLVTLVLAIVLQAAYHGVILLWILLGLPLLIIAKAIGHIGRADVGRIHPWSDPEPPHSGDASRQEVRFTFDELALIYKSLEAVKTLGALPPRTNCSKTPSRSSTRA